MNLGIDPRQVWRDWNTDGVPSSLKHKPRKTEIRKLMTDWWQTLIALVAEQEGLTLPNFAIKFTVTGGTANAIEADASPEPPESPGVAVYILSGIAADNTGPVTINGKPWRTNVGNEFVAGGIKAGGIYLFLDNGDHYRALTDQDVSALVAAAEGYANAALSAVPNAFPINRGALADLPDTITNAYLTEPGYEGQFSLVDVSGGAYDDLIAADTTGGEIKITNGNPDLAYLRQGKYGDLFKTSGFDGDIGVALAAASKRAALMGSEKLATVEINDSVAILSAGLIIPPNVELLGLDTVIDASNLVDGDLIGYYTGVKEAGGRVVLDARPLPGVSFEDHYTELPEFDPISVGDSYVDFHSLPDLAEGSIFTLYDTTDYSWITFDTGSDRPYYRNGARMYAMDKPVSISGGKYRVYTDTRFRDAFTYGDDVRAYRQAVRKGRLGGFTIQLNDNAITTIYGIAATGFVDSKFEDIKIFGARTAGLDIHQSYGVIAERISASAKLSASGSASYPALFTNSTRCRIRDGRMAGYWHAIDAGGNDLPYGAVPNYDCVYEDISTIGTENSNFTAGFHGFSDACGYRRCNVSQLSLGGREPFFDDGEIGSLKDTGNPNQVVYFSELYGGSVRIARTKISSLRNGGTSDPAIWALARAGVQSEIFLDMHDVVLDMPNETCPMIVGSNATATAGVSLHFRGRANIPAATTAGLVRVWAPTAADITYSYLKVEVEGLTSGIPFGSGVNSTYGAPKFAARPKFPRQSGIWATDSAAVASELSDPINYPHPYPLFFAPQGGAMAQSWGKGAKASAGLAGTPSSTQIRPHISSGDGTNMSAASVDVLWWAE